METLDSHPPCRLCRAPLRHVALDLGMSPLCQTRVLPEQLDASEEFFPLRVRVCESCYLVQLAESVSPQRLFQDYPYFSSYVDQLVESGRRYCEAVSARFGLGKHSRVVEVASNDGYLLQHFVARGIPALGIEPAENVAAAAIARGVPTLSRFFGRETAEFVAARDGRADLILCNNVFAHVPDLNDFIAGLALLLAPGGVVTLEFPHLLTLLDGNQFDTIYHEHFSYFSFTTASLALARHGLTVFDVEEIAVHGGSLRLFARHEGHASLPVSAAVAAFRARERDAGLASVERYRAFAERVHTTKNDLLGALIELKRAGKQIVGYGAAGKSVTLLNYCGIRTDYLDYLVDRNPYKQGTFFPGVRIPIHAPDRIAQTKPDYVLILPWNLRDEVIRYTAGIREWGGRWIVPIPRLEIVS
ncbi:MAG: class I SAM-dependent methyltransferase [Myxococcota bacterium]